MPEKTPFKLARQIVAYFDLSGLPEGAVYADAVAVAEALIRREEGVEVKYRCGLSCFCGNCDRAVIASNYCPACGTRLKWPEGKR